VSRRGRGGLVAGLLVLGTIATADHGAVAGAVTSRPPLPAPGSVPAVGFLHVVVPPTGGGAGATPYLADAAGRQVLLHGVAVVGLQDVAYPGANGGPALFPVSPSAYDGRCPAPQPRIPQPPLCEVDAAKAAYGQSTAPGSGDDLAQMRALGFDVIRLVLNWSQLEPTPGRYSTTYLSRVAQVVGWARQQGIYVILDMHQDQYSRYLLASSSRSLPAGCTPSGGGDGAPRWAVLTDGKPSCALFGQGDLNPAESAAFYNFWHDATVADPRGEAPGVGLEDHYIGALAALARHFEDDPAVLGYELMNEPQPGSLASLPVANLYQESSQDLYPFYRRAIEALTGVRDGLATCPPSAPTSLAGRCAYPQLARVRRQQIFFEPFAYRNLLDFSPQVSAPFSAYPNLVYAPHVYTHAFTVDQFLGYPVTGSPYPPSYEFGYQTAEAEAQAMHAAVFTTEFGDASSTDATVLAGETVAQAATLTGGTLWAWKGLAKTAGSCWCVRWLHSDYQTTANGTPGNGNPHNPVSKDHLIPSRQRYLSEVWPRATAGTLLAYRYDPVSSSFEMAAADRHAVGKADIGAQTVVYIPADVAGAVNVSGAAVLSGVVREPDGSRLAYVAPAHPHTVLPGMGVVAGEYWVSVGSPSAAVRATILHALSRPSPIGEPAARALAEQMLTDALSSPDSSIRAKAHLAEALAGLLLGTSDPNTTPLAATG